MIVLGVDPGTAALGYGIVERRTRGLRAIDYGCLVTSPDRSLPERLLAVHRLLAELLDVHRPDVVAVERLFVSRNVQTALGVGQARGVVLLAAAQAGVPVREATPSAVKTAIAGYGGADKGQVARMVRVLLGLPETPAPDDVADALGVAIWAAHTAAAPAPATSAIVDRAAVAPIGRGKTPFERAVEAALARERGADGPRRTASGGTGGSEDGATGL
ncbi:MAG TPA: crossover junction endodeoxyribonuclease RuvC, partial [Candidatus Limnocylindrales bacterium]|nr:crossover junction endodeoxyribonuclease RuvC [Candidatus Limnocylindrales bacterium]